jgi:uncharacterized protein YbaR (Trm112 family)
LNLPSLIVCPGCNHQLTLPDDFSGERAVCPKCRLEFAPFAAAIPAMEVDPSRPKINADTAPTTKPEDPLPLPPLQGAYAPKAVGTTARPTVEVPAMYCIECGTKFSKTERGCPACGLAIEAMVEPTRRPGRMRSRELPPLAGYLPMLAAILVAVGAAFFISAPIGDEMFRRGPQSLRNFFMIFGVCAGILAELAALICIIIWHYQAWRLISQGDEEYSPGLMVGLLFVPFFNLYWMFRAVPGLSTAIQQELRNFAPYRTFGAGWTPGLIACIAALIPYGQPVAFCIFLAWMFIANNALHRLIRFHEEANEGRREPAIDPEVRIDY